MNAVTMSSGFLPPANCSTKSKYVNTGKVGREQQRPGQVPAPVRIHSSHATHKETWIDPGHVRVLCCKGQGKAGAHSEHKAHQVKPKCSAI